MSRKPVRRPPATPKSPAVVRAANERKPPVRRAPDAPSEQKRPVRRAPDAPSVGRKPVRRAPDAPSERKPPIRRAPDAPSERKPPIRRAPDNPDADKAPMIAEPPRGGTKRSVARARPAAGSPAGAPPALGLLHGAKPKAAKKPAPTSFRQRVGASGRQLLLFNMVRARTRLQAALQGLAPGTTERPIGEGRWNIREIVLHLHFWDREALRALDSALHGIRPSWSDFDREDYARANAAGLDALRHLGWEEAVRALHGGRHALIEAIERISELPPEVWRAEHPLGELLHALPTHDLHHADAIKRWRAGTGA
jgi:hypothetical protein